MGAGGIMPVVIVIHGGSVPAAIVGFQSNVVPLHARVSIRDDHAFAVKAQRPDLRRIHSRHVPLNSSGDLGGLTASCRLRLI